MQAYVDCQSRSPLLYNFSLKEHIIMPDIPRLNGVIKALEQGQTAFVAFTPVDIESAVAMAGSRLDGVAFEMEHAPLDVRGLREALQFMLDRRQIVERTTLAPAVTPLVRIPPNGGEMNQWIAKQVLDIGVFGIIFPHISTVEEAWNAVGACRYPRLSTAPLYNPPGIRGDAPARAARYWGLTQQEYYSRADVWPLAPQGEILVVIQCEDTRAIDNLPRILKEVPGVGVVLIGEGDLSQELGHPRNYDHPVVADAINSILKICKEHNVACGHPHPDAGNIERLVSSGYRFLMPSVPRAFGVLEQGRKLTGRN
jgi:4-hydroxy-2-oxoheptanedioate aldolase